MINPINYLHIFSKHTQTKNIFEMKMSLLQKIYFLHSEFISVKNKKVWLKSNEVLVKVPILGRAAKRLSTARPGD